MNHCPTCGAFTSTRTKTVILGTRPNGAKLMGIITMRRCAKCDWTGTRHCTVPLDYAKKEANADRLILASWVEKEEGS